VTASSAGSTVIVASHDAAIPTAPIAPNWLNPRNAVSISEPYAIAAARDAVAVARIVAVTERAIASSSAAPARRSSSYRASWMIAALIPLPRMIEPRNEVDALSWPNATPAAPSATATPHSAGAAISGTAPRRPKNSATARLTSSTHAIDATARSPSSARRSRSAS